MKAGLLLVLVFALKGFSDLAPTAFSYQTDLPYCPAKGCFPVDRTEVRAVQRIGRWIQFQFTDDFKTWHSMGGPRPNYDQLQEASLIWYAERRWALFFRVIESDDPLNVVDFERPPGALFLIYDIKPL